MHDVDLLRRLRSFDLNVVEVAGWQTRGSASFQNRAHLTHHTGGSRRGAAPTLKAVINGLDRPDLGYFLPGPLAQTYTDRNNVVYLVAAGTANHAGKGGMFGLSGNSSVAGTEHEHSGDPAEPVTPERWETIARVAAAHASGHFGAERCIQHYEWTTRKVDFVKQLNHADAQRRRVAELLRQGGVHPVPRPQTEEEELMAAKDEIIRVIQQNQGLPRLVKLKDAGQVDGKTVPAGTWMVIGAYGRLVVSESTGNALRWFGLVQNAAPAEVSFSQVSLPDR